MSHLLSHPRDATMPLVVELPVSHLQRIHTLLDADHSLSVEQIIQSALLLYLAYKLPELCCRLPTPSYDIHLSPTQPNGHC